MTGGNQKEIIHYTPGANLPGVDYREGIPGTFEEEINLRDYIDVVLRRKWLIISMLFFTFISTLIFSLAAVKTYKASGSLEINQDSQNITKFEDMANERLYYEEFIATQAALLNSDTLARRVIDSLQLAEHPVIVGDRDKQAEPGLMKRFETFIKSKIPRQDSSETSPGISFEEVRKDNALLSFIKGNLEISPQTDSLIIDVFFSSASRQLSQDVVNTLMDEFVSWKMDQKVASSRKAREYLMRQIDRAKINLEEAEEKQNQFARQAGIVSMDSRLNSVFRQLEDINAALGSADADLIHKKAKYEQSLKDGPSSLPEVLNSQLINMLKSEYAQLRSEYENAIEIFNAEYPDVKTLKNRMDSIDARIENESRKIFNATAHDYQAALNRVQSLEEKLDERKQQALELNERATQYNIMAREVETNKAIYQSLLERAKEIESMAGISPSNIEIVDRANLPIFSDKPNVKRNLMLSIFLGLLMGMGMAFLVEYFADTITNPDQIAERFQIPILGVIPLEKTTPEYPVEQIFRKDPQAGMSEALRTSKVSIQLSGSGNNARCIAVTSTEPGEGKTTIAANLAQAFAGAGEKVMLIDADLRKPRLHKIFPSNNGKNGTGLSSFLAGIINNGYITKTEVENLYLIPSGPIPPNPVELLASSRFSKLIHKLSEKFDRIIIDAPPHHGFADVLVLSRQVGGMILVSSVGETTREGLRHFKKSMNNVQGNVLGCIVNKINISQRYGYRAYYRYYRAYHYHYGHKSPREELPKIAVNA